MFTALKGVLITMFFTYLATIFTSDSERAIAFSILFLGSSYIFVQVGKEL